VLDGARATPLEVSRMRMLQIHSDGFSFEAKRKALKSAKAVKAKTYVSEESWLVNFLSLIHI